MKIHIRRVRFFIKTKEYSHIFKNFVGSKKATFCSQKGHHLVKGCKLLMAALKQNEHIKTQNFLTELQFLLCVTGSETGMFTLYPSRNASHRYFNKLSKLICEFIFSET